MFQETVPLAAWRNRAFVETYTLIGEDGEPLDLTDLTIRMEVRQYGAQPGAALISLGEVSSDIEGIRIYDPETEAADPTKGRIRIIIDISTLAAMPGGPTDGTEPNAPDTFVYDVVVTGAMPFAPLAFGGSFAVWPGVTEPA